MPAASAAKPTSTFTDWQPLRLLSFYRVVLAGLLAVLYFALQDSNPFGIQRADMFRSTLMTYLAFSIAAGFTTRMRWPGHDSQALLQILADIGAIALLMHATGGVTSPLSVFLVIAVVAGTWVLPGRLAYLFASVAALAVLFESGLANLAMDKTGAGNITRAGLMGAVVFIAAGLTHILIIRAREGEALAEQRGIDLENLEQLNRYIIQQLQSGLLVVDNNNTIRLANDTAQKLLGLDNPSTQQLATAAPELENQLQQWKLDSGWQAQAITGSAGSSLLPRFGALKTAQGQGALILLEDSAQLAQQTQQVKLASLGRLTASIAHEIRNPLGAISHASQLLEESEQLDHSDKRLTEIIGTHTRRVNTIIENVLQLSRRSVNQPQQLVLQDWLSDFKDEFMHMEHLEPGQMQLNVTPPDLQLYVDPGQLHQILTNLCQNALRHGGNPAQLLLRAQSDAHNFIQLDIVDNGEGIDSETADQIFEPFYTTEASGTGLGLFIARELCETNHGHLSYTPEAGGGSCFRIHFVEQSQDSLS
ncbi:PAS domain-containing sensor histidine kinase [Pseudomonadota bacterium]